MFGLGIACAGAAGVALAMVFPFSPNTQVQWLAWAFLVVILGGLGSVANTLAAGIAVGLIQTVCTALCRSTTFISFSTCCSPSFSSCAAKA